MLGLKRGQVRLEAWRPEWAEKAQETAEVLKQVLGEAAADIQHVGSTAIPGICAKPIVDLVVGFRQLGEARAFLPARNGALFSGDRTCLVSCCLSRGILNRIPGIAIFMGWNMGAKPGKTTSIFEIIFEPSRSGRRLITPSKGSWPPDFPRTDSGIPRGKAC